MGDRKQVRKLQELGQTLEKKNASLQQNINIAVEDKKKIEMSRTKVMVSRDESLKRVQLLENQTNELKVELAALDKEHKQQLAAKLEENVAKVQSLENSLKGWKELVLELNAEEDLGVDDAAAAPSAPTAR